MRKDLSVRALLLIAVAAVTLAFAGPASAAKYLVVYHQQAVPADAAKHIRAAGGTVIVQYDAIGVVLAQADSTSFADRLAADNRIEAVAVSNQPVAKAEPFGTDSHDEQPPELPNAPAGQDTFAPLQWDMRQIHAPEANSITGGSPAVVVGDIDTGVDKDHPDLVQNIDFSKSASCESGFPDQDPAAWDDHNGHGTHTTGTMAAAFNGIGITGVAPNVKIAAIKSSLDSGFFFVEMIVCSFLWAGGAPFDDPTTPGLDISATTGPRADITNNSYFMDPFLYNCRNDPVQRALWKAAQRAILYAYQQGVTHVAAIGNDFDDRAHPTLDFISPDYPPGEEVTRDVGNECVVVPVEVPGVIGVTGVGNHRQTDGDDDPNDFQKSFFSAYGVGVADVTAPSGDSIFVTPEAPNGRVLSTWPTEVPCPGPASRRLDDPASAGAAYCYLQGTSMASPHAAGVAALIVSRFGDLKNPQNGKMRPGAVEQYMQHTSDPQPCPTELSTVFTEVFTLPSGEPQACDGGEGYNSWYGSGQVNALKAITHNPANEEATTP